MAADLGTDVWCDGTDFQLHMPIVSGRLAVAQAVARRLTTPRGRMPFHADYGTDLRLFLNAPVISPQAIASAVEAEAAKDERVESTSVEVSVAGFPQTLTVDVEIETADGPFELVLSVTQAKVTILDLYT